MPSGVLTHDTPVIALAHRDGAVVIHATERVGRGCREGGDGGATRGRARDRHRPGSRSRRRSRRSGRSLRGCGLVGDGRGLVGGNGGGVLDSGLFGRLVVGLGRGDVSHG